MKLVFDRQSYVVCYRVGVLCIHPSPPDLPLCCVNRAFPSLLPLLHWSPALPAAGATVPRTRAAAQRPRSSPDPRTADPRPQPPSPPTMLRSTPRHFSTDDSTTGPSLFLPSAPVLALVSIHIYGLVLLYSPPHSPRLPPPTIAALHFSPSVNRRSHTSRDLSSPLPCHRHPCSCTRACLRQSSGVVI